MLRRIELRLYMGRTCHLVYLSPLWRGCVPSALRCWPVVVVRGWEGLATQLLVVGGASAIILAAAVLNK